MKGESGKVGKGMQVDREKARKGQGEAFNLGPAEEMDDVVKVLLERLAEAQPEVSEAGSLAQQPEDHVHRGAEF